VAGSTGLRRMLGVGIAHPCSRICLAVIPVGSDHRWLAAERDFSGGGDWTHTKRLTVITARHPGAVVVSRT